MAVEIFAGVLLAGISLMLVYWVFTTWSWVAIILLFIFSWMLVKFVTRRRYSAEETKQRKSFEEQKEEQFKKLKAEELASLTGVRKFFHILGTVWLYFAISMIVLGIIISVVLG